MSVEEKERAKKRDVFSSLFKKVRNLSPKDTRKEKYLTREELIEQETSDQSPSIARPTSLSADAAILEGSPGDQRKRAKKNMHAPAPPTFRSHSVIAQMTPEEVKDGLRRMANTESMSSSKGVEPNPDAGDTDSTITDPAMYKKKKAAPEPPSPAAAGTTEQSQPVPETAQTALDQAGPSPSPPSPPLVPDQSDRSETDFEQSSASSVASSEAADIRSSCQQKGSLPKSHNSPALDSRKNEPSGDFKPTRQASVPVLETLHNEPATTYVAESVESLATMPSIASDSADHKTSLKRWTGNEREDLTVPKEKERDKAKDSCSESEASHSNANLSQSGSDSGDNGAEEVLQSVVKKDGAAKEILILRKILVEEQDALLVLPYAPIVQEKIKAFTPLGLELGIIVEEYAGGRGRIPPTRHRRKRVLYVATIERAASLPSSLIEMGRLQSHLGLVVVDEFHMIGDGSRGVTLEQLLTRLRGAHPSCQIVGMSATLSNVKDLAAFLNAQIYGSDYRPVKLTQRVKIGDSVYKVPTEERGGDLEFERKLSTHFKSAAAPNFGPDSDRLVDLASEIVPDSSCMVYCPSKNNAENVAKLLAKALFPTMSKVKAREKKEMLQTLQREGDERVCPLLQRCTPSGVAYHHSGLTAHERSIVPEAYLEGTLCIICCTSTLAAGVNLPAKRVTIRSPFVDTARMSSGQYKQTSGRAGRAGLDSEGESTLILPNDASKTKYRNNLLKNGVVPAKSQLSAQGGAGIRSLILSAVSLGLAFNQTDLVTLAKKTFLACQGEPDQATSTFNDGLNVLFEKNLLRLETESGALSISKLGKAVTKASIDMEAVKSIYEELTVASQCTVLSSYLHLLYISIPSILRAFRLI